MDKDFSGGNKKNHGTGVYVFGEYIRGVITG
jgi:hypothetical protein